MADKKKIVYIFPTQERAMFWMQETYQKFMPAVVQVSKFKRFIEFKDEIWYFYRDEPRYLRGMHFDEYRTDMDIMDVLNDDRAIDSLVKEKLGVTDESN